MACPLPNGEKAATTAFRAGLCQWHDFLDEGHELSQSIEGVGAYHLGDYWHAIMHRREPDYGNSKYWFRRVGPQPIFESLEQRATEILSECPETEAKSWLSRLTANGWDPFAFVDLCEACAADENAPLSLAARAIQRVEMLALLEFNYQQI